MSIRALFLEGRAPPSSEMLSRVHSISKRGCNPANRAMMSGISTKACSMVIQAPQARAQGFYLPRVMRNAVRGPGDMTPLREMTMMNP